VDGANCLKQESDHEEKGTTSAMVL
jgi:hypothetical protein